MESTNKTRNRYLGIYNNQRGHCEAKTTEDAREIFAGLWGVSKEQIHIYKCTNDGDWFREEGP